MTRADIEALEERVRHLTATIDQLDEGVAEARTRVTTLEATVADPSSCLHGSNVPATLGTAEAPVGGRDEATPEEVAAAVQAVEEGDDGADTNTHDDDILIV